MDEIISFLQSEDVCLVCRKERKTNLFKGEKVSMCISCYAKKIFKEFEPVEIDYSEYAYNTGGKRYKLTKAAKWYRKFYKEDLWKGND
jgi:hypothetical protein